LMVLPGWRWNAQSGKAVRVGGDVDVRQVQFAAERTVRVVCWMSPHDKRAEQRHGADGQDGSTRSGVNAPGYHGSSRLMGPQGLWPQLMPALAQYETSKGQ